MQVIRLFLARRTCYLTAAFLTVLTLVFNRAQRRERHSAVAASALAARAGSGAEIAPPSIKEVLELVREIKRRRALRRPGWEMPSADAVGFEQARVELTEKDGRAAIVSLLDGQSR